jgi:hypothetical protein
MKFQDYGDLVICNDAGRPWRRGIFEHYKAARKKQQRESNVDWGMIYDSVTSIRNEVRDNMPYMNLTVTTARQMMSSPFLLHAFTRTKRS